MMHSMSRAKQGTLPAKSSFLSIDNPTIQMSTIKKAARQDGTVIRLYNTSDSEASCVISGLDKAASVEVVNANEEKSSVEGVAASLEGGKIQVSATGKKIITLLVK